MIFKCILLGNSLSLCMKIINSVVVVGLYYGFLTTFSIGPSYLLLLRARVMEEGTEKEVSATTGFLAGQLIMFISIYYAPLHLALGRPHTITVLVIPYLLLNFFWNNQKNFFDDGSTTRNSMRNLSIQCVFLNNLIFQLLNHFILPSSTLARLVNISMFRCNNKILFLTSSFVGWLIGHILFMKWVKLVLFWIRQNHSIRIRSNKYLVSELRNSMARIFSILLFITCVYYLGRMPSPIVTRKMRARETSETEEGGERNEESDVEKTYKMKEIKQEQEGSTEENLYLFSEEREDLEKIYETEEIRVNGKEKTKYEFHFKEARYQDSPVYEDSDLETHQENWELGRLKEEKKKRIKKDIYMWVEKIFVSFLFDFNRWNRPLRYIKNDNLENALRNEMSQFFFFTCTSDGKQIISFTYPPSLSTFSEILEQIISLYIIEKLYDKDIYNYWINTNEKRKCNLNNELKRRIQILEKNEVSSSLDILEKRTILCDDEKKEKCLPKAYDPFFNGPYRGTRKELDSRTIMNIYKDTEDLVEFFFINKIHDLFLNYFVELHCQSFLNPIGEKGIDSENQEKDLQFVFDVITTQTKDKKTLKKKSIGMRIKEVSKKVSRWSYKLTESFIDEEEENEHDEYLEEDEHELYSRRFKRVTVYNDYDDDNDPNADSDYKMAEIVLLRYSKESDFRRNLIKGSMRAQRRKTVIWNFFQGDAHSPLFLDRIDKIYFFFSFDIKKLKNVILSIWMGREQGSELKIGNLEDEDTNEQVRISEVWESYLIPHILRSLILLTHSFIRKYILLPSLIIAKNTFRVLLFQIPEWNKDFQEWKKETHIKCTYNGVQLSENKFPQGWLLNGIQIKILYPFCLKPWRKSKAQSHHKNLMKKKEKKINFYFLTVWGLETEVPFGPPRKQPSFFKPIYKEIYKEIKKETKNMKKRFLQVLKSLNKEIKSFQKIRKEETKGVIKIVQVIKSIMKKVNTIFLFELRKEKAYEPNKDKKDFKRNNKIICESSVLNRTINWLDYSLIEKRTKGLYDKTIKIRNQIERTTKEKKEIVLNSDNKGSGSQKPIWKIFKSKNIRLMRKSYYFIQLFIEKIYIDILLCIITFSKINAQLLFESTKKIFNKSIYNNEIKNKINKEQEGIDKKNQNTMNFLLTIKKLFSNTENIKNSNQDPNNYWDLSFLSQAYVFYKISQNQLLNKSLLRSVLQYKGSYPFFKDNFKDYCITHGIFNYKSTHKKINTYVINEWKNWLKVHYQYALSKKERSRLVPKECQNTINEHRMIQNKQSNQSDLYKKYQFISLMNKNDYEVNSFMSKKDKWKKHYRYDLLTSQYISFPNLYISGSTLERNGDQEITYHFNILKPESLYVLVSIPSNDYIEKEYLIDSNTNLDRKYFDCRILNLYFIEDIDIEIWTNAHIGIKIQKDTKTEINNLKIKNFKRMEKRYLFFPTIDQEIKPSNQKSLFFDWRGMNKERLYDTTSNHYTRSNSNLETWFFPEFVLLFDVYQIRPWILPIKSLFFNFSINEESKNININTKKFSTKKIFLEFFLELFNFKQEENEQQVQGNLVWNIQKKKQYKNNNELDLFLQQRELNFFLKKHLLFQLGSTNLLHKQIMDDIRICSLLLRLKKPKDIAIAYLQRDELNLTQMIIQKDLVLAEVIKRGIFMIEPILLSIQKEVKSIIYQTMDISLVDNKKHQTKKKKRYIEKMGFEKSIARHNNIFLSGDKNHYDLLVPENILSPRRCREFRIRICFNSRNFDVVDRNPRFCNENKIRNCEQFLNENKHINTDRKNVIKFKLFLWPYYRLEDLACMNRYWFDTNNSSCFSMSRIHMYSQFKMN